MERAGETLPQPIIIIINGMGAGDVLLNGCGANGSKEEKGGRLRDRVAVIGSI